jgi:SAM-dependent methyltransferase
MASFESTLTGARVTDTVYDLPEIGELYDHVGAYVHRKDVDFWIDEARNAKGRVLEVGCGTGRVLLPVARAGIEISGLDRAHAMLEKCRGNLEREAEDVRARVRLHEADMRDFDLGEHFRLVIAPFRSFQHLVAIDEQLNALRSIHRHLDPGGRFVFDTFNVQFHYLVDPSRADEREDTPDTELSNGRRFRRTARVAAVHYVEQTSDVELTYYITDGDGRTSRVTQSFPMRWYLRSEVEHLLARAGFVLHDVYGDYDRSPLADGSPVMIFIAEKH